jgi:hypothetical protein
MDRLQQALEAAGIAFIDENGRRPRRGATKAVPEEEAGLRLAPHHGSINFPVAALIAASVRVAAPSLPRALSV